jgi:cytochrome bd-type quinol oxidase subunit 1
MSIAPVERAAAILLGIEGLVLMALAGWEIVALVSGDLDSLSSSIALIVLTVVGACAVIAFAVAAWRGASWGRSGGIVTQLLAIAVAAGALTGPDPQVAAAVLIAVPAVAGLVLLVAAARAAARRLRDTP